LCFVKGGKFLHLLREARKLFGGVRTKLLKDLNGPKGDYVTGWRKLRVEEL